MSVQENQREKCFQSVCSAVSTFVASNLISLVSLALFVLSDICCVLLFPRELFQLFQE